MDVELKGNTESDKAKAWTITCPDRYCRAESPFTAWIERGFFRCPKCGMLCCLLASEETMKLYSTGVYVRW